MPLTEKKCTEQSSSVNAKTSQNNEVVAGYDATTASILFGVDAKQIQTLCKSDLRNTLLLRKRTSADDKMTSGPTQKSVYQHCLACRSYRLLCSRLVAAIRV